MGGVTVHMEMKEHSAVKVGSEGPAQSWRSKCNELLTWLFYFVADMTAISILAFLFFSFSFY